MVYLVSGQILCVNKLLKYRSEAGDWIGLKSWLILLIHNELLSVTGDCKLKFEEQHHDLESQLNWSQTKIY